MSENIKPEYERRSAALTEAFEKSMARARMWMQALLIALMAFLFLGYRGVFSAGRGWWGFVMLAGIAALIPLQLRARNAAQRAVRLLKIYELGLARMDGSGTQSGHTGKAFVETGHLYERDLDVLGENSIFGMLATTRTAVGQRALARLLLNGADADVARARQAAVLELAPMLDLRERVAMLGRSAFDQLPAESFERWLDKPRGGLKLWMRWVLVASVVVWIGLLVVDLSHGVETALLVRNLAAVLLLQGAFALWLRLRVMAELEAAQKLAGQTEILRDGLRVLREETFSSELLKGLQQDASAERALKRVMRSLTLVEQRSKEWYYAPALLLAVGTQAAISLEAWKREYGDAMRVWTAAWAEFEALLAVATYAVEHHENVYPAIVESAAKFEAEGLAHPLLPASVAVKNDVRLDEETRFLLISGSNMAGKSTLLRAVGCNVVMALSGAPVCAKAVTMSALRVGASLALVDSLAEGKSKFLAEVERLRDLVALAKAHRGNMLFLIDEIFSGTNSADRRAAAEAVLRGLIREGAIGALSTHDLALAELGEIDALHGKNVHMASPDESDPLGFDYLLKAGVNRTTNALAIVKMLGLVE